MWVLLSRSHGKETGADNKAHTQVLCAVTQSPEGGVRRGRGSASLAKGFTHLPHSPCSRGARHCLPPLWDALIAVTRRKIAGVRKGCWKVRGEGRTKPW